MNKFCHHEEFIMTGFITTCAFLPQKARLARIRIAKASSSAAFVNKKKAAEARMAAQESGIELDDNFREEDIFELQHHHLLRCLEKTTVIYVLTNVYVPAPFPACNASNTVVKP